MKLPSLSSLPRQLAGCRRSTCWWRTLVSTLSVALGGSALISAENTPSTKVPVAERMGSVWSISDGDNTIYLAGSVHLLREEDYPVSPFYDQVYDDSESIVMEVDLGEMLNPEGILKVQRLGMFGPDDSLDRHLSAELIDRLKAYLQTHPTGQLMALGLPKMKPGMILLSISSLEAMRMNARPELGLETTIYQKAMGDGKTVSGLETVEFQMTCFDELSDKEIEKLLGETLDEVDEMSAKIDKLIAAWHRGEEGKLDTLMNEEMEEGKVRELLLTERNANWIPHIEKAIKGSRNVMFLVGAAHLVGKDSVVDLLRKKGYQVEKVVPKAALKKAA